MAVNGANVPITQTGIAWKSDREDKFGAYQPQNFNTVPELRGGAAIGGVDNTTNIVSAGDPPFPFLCEFADCKGLDAPRNL